MLQFDVSLSWDIVLFVAGAVTIGVAGVVVLWVAM